MNKPLLKIVVLCGILGIGLAGIVMANGALDGDAMMVSPSTIVLARVNTISVHTNIPASSVVDGSLSLSGLSPSYVYADNLGHIAARFSVAPLELESGKSTLVLEGAYINGGSFIAIDVVRVK